MKVVTQLQLFAVLTLCMGIAVGMCIYGTTYAAVLTGRYVTLLAVSDDNRVSALDDKLPEQCQTMIERLRALGGFKYLDCVPVDYAKENQKR